MTWQALPNGQSINVSSGNLYAVLASVKNTHNQTDLTNLAQSKWGLQVVSYGEQGQANWPNLPTDPNSGHKTVFAILSATQNASIPWSVPWPLSWADDSSISAAWSSSDSTDQNVAPTPAAQQAAPAAQATSPQVQVAGGTTVPTVSPTPLTSAVVVPSVSPVVYVGAGVAFGVGAWMARGWLSRLLLPKGPHPA